MAQQPTGAIITQLRGIRQIETRGINTFQWQIDTRHLILGSSQRAKYEHLLIRLRQHDPFSSPCFDKRSNSKTHTCLPKIFGYSATLAAQSSLCPKRITM